MMALASARPHLIDRLARPRQEAVRRRPGLDPVDQPLAVRCHGHAADADVQRLGAVGRVADHEVVIRLARCLGLPQHGPVRLGAGESLELAASIMEAASTEAALDVLVVGVRDLFDADWAAVIDPSAGRSIGEMIPEAIEAEVLMEISAKPDRREPDTIRNNIEKMFGQRD